MRRSSLSPGGPTPSRSGTGRWIRPPTTAPRTTKRTSRAAVPHRGRPKDQVEGIIDAFDELTREDPGDILVFLSGEREIRDAADALNDHVARAARKGPREPGRRLGGRPALRPSVVAGAAARLPAPRQAARRPRDERGGDLAHGARDQVRHRHPGSPASRATRTGRRSSGCRSEPISQASANQRKGRSGRTSDGICIRLYSEEDFDARPEFTDPEILRTNLASVILQMATLGFVRTEKDVTDFPFLTPPDPRAVRDGRALLAELGGTAHREGRRADRHGDGAADRSPADRSAPRADGHRRSAERVRGGGRRHRRRTVDAGSARASRRAEGRGGRAPRALHPPAQRLPVLPRTVELRPRAVADAVELEVPQDDPRGVPQLRPHPRMAGPRRTAALARRLRRDPAGRGDVEDGCPRRRGRLDRSPGARRGPPRRRRCRPLRRAGRRDPHVPAHRPAVDDRPEAAGRSRVPGGPRLPLPDLPRLRALQEGPGLRHERRARRDVAAVGAHGRVGGPRLDRRGGRRSREAHPCGAPLVREERSRGRGREGDALRSDPVCRASGLLRAHRSGRRPRALHPTCPGRGRLARVARVPADERAHARGGRRARLPHPRSPCAGGRGRSLRLLRRARPGRRPHRLRLHRVVEEEAARGPRAPRRAARDAARGGRGGPHRRPRPRLSDALGAARTRRYGGGRARRAAVLVRTGRRGRRG